MVVQAPGRLGGTFPKPRLPPRVAQIRLGNPVAPSREPSLQLVLDSGAREAGGRGGSIHTEHTCGHYLLLASVPFRSCQPPGV